MRSGSTAHDGGGWPSAQRPYPDEATSGPVQHGPGARSDPQEGPGGGREVPFGPEVSWPRGFRPLDPQTREVLESAYDTGTVYQQPAIDDYGYGDPGYADPSYDGPRARTRIPRSGATAGPGRRPSWSGTASGIGPDTGLPGPRCPATRYPDFRSQPQDLTAAPAAPKDGYPVTGAQEARPDTAPHSPQPLARGWAEQDSRRLPQPAVRPTRSSGTAIRAVTTRVRPTRVRPTRVRPTTAFRRPASGRWSFQRPAPGGHALRRVALRRAVGGRAVR